MRARVFVMLRLNKYTHATGKPSRRADVWEHAGNRGEGGLPDWRCPLGARVYGCLPRSKNHSSLLPIVGSRLKFISSAGRGTRYWQYLRCLSKIYNNHGALSSRKIIISPFPRDFPHQDPSIINKSRKLVPHALGRPKQQQQLSFRRPSGKVKHNAAAN